MDADAAALARAAQQHGIISIAQAREAGLSRDQVATRLHRGQLIAVHRGVYAVAGSPLTHDQRLMAAVLASRGVASHRAALRLWDFEPPEVLEEVTIEERRDGLAVHVEGCRARAARQRLLASTAFYEALSGQEPPRTP